jgi:hypothetical protein
MNEFIVFTWDGRDSDLKYSWTSTSGGSVGTKESVWNVEKKGLC